MEKGRGVEEDRERVEKGRGVEEDRERVEKGRGVEEDRERVEKGRGVEEDRERVEKGKGEEGEEGREGENEGLLMFSRWRWRRYLCKILSINFERVWLARAVPLNVDNSHAMYHTQCSLCTNNNYHVSMSPHPCNKLVAMYR